MSRLKYFPRPLKEGSHLHNRTTLWLSCKCIRASLDRFSQFFFFVLLCFFFLFLSNDTFLHQRDAHLKVNDEVPKSKKDKRERLVENVNFFFSFSVAVFQGPLCM